MPRLTPGFGYGKNGPQAFMEAARGRKTARTRDQAVSGTVKPTLRRESKFPTLNLPSIFCEDCDMKRVVALSTAAFFFVGLSGLPPAQAVSLGEAKYNANCAVCHGVTGKGDGPFAKLLKEDVPSLTILSKNNGGVFPFERVYASIDGRKEVQGHGTREMPIWGKRYAAKSLKMHDPFLGRWYAEEIIRTRILALVEYIASLQE